MASYFLRVMDCFSPNTCHTDDERRTEAYFCQYIIEGERILTFPDGKCLNWPWPNTRLLPIDRERDESMGGAAALFLLSSISSFSPGSKIEVSFAEGDTAADPYPSANTCLPELTLPVCHRTYSDFLRCMDDSLLTGYIGFGMF